jgi:hypothetical protein
VDDDEEWHVSGDSKLGGAVGRLIQCFVEEAESSPNTISSALQLIAYFAHGCRTKDDWVSLCRGPYGEELFNKAWELLLTVGLKSSSWVMNTCAGIAGFQKPIGYWASAEGVLEIDSLLQSDSKEGVGRGLLISMGILWNRDISNEGNLNISDLVGIDKIEPHLFDEDPVIRSIATWVWANTRKGLDVKNIPSQDVLNGFLRRWIDGKKNRDAELAGYAMACLLGIDRDLWRPKIEKSKIQKIRDRFNALLGTEPGVSDYDKVACFFVAYHSKSILTDAELASQFKIVERSNRIFGKIPNIDTIRKTLGVVSPTKKTARRG